MKAKNKTTGAEISATIYEVFYSENGGDDLDKSKIIYKLENGEELTPSEFINQYHAISFNHNHRK